MRTRLSITNTHELPSLGSGVRILARHKLLYKYQNRNHRPLGAVVAYTDFEFPNCQQRKVIVGYHSAARRHSHSTTRNTADPHRAAIAESLSHRLRTRGGFAPRRSGSVHTRFVGAQGAVQVLLPARYR